MQEEAQPTERASAATPDAAFDVAPELFDPQTDDHHNLRDNAAL